MERDGIPSLTGIRGIAALLVVFYHLPLGKMYRLDSAVPIISQGYFGVDLFFILSGFILMYVHAREFETLRPASLRSFFIVRFFRVYPLHFFTLLAILAFTTLNPLYVDWCRSLPRSSHIGEMFSLPGFFQTLTLTNRVGLPDLGPWNVPSWSLSSEILAYGAFPFGALALMRVRSQALCYLIAITFLGIFATATFARGQTGGVSGMACCFIAGMSLGRAKGLRQSAPWAYWLTIASGFGAIVFLAMPSLAPLSVFAFAGLIYGLSLHQSFVTAFLSSVPAMFLGRISFSLYLTHFTAAHWAIWRESLPTAHPTGALLLVLALLLVVATATFYAVEQPFHAIGRRYGNRR